VSTAPLRVGLIGYGLGGRVFHAPLIAVTPRLRLDVIVTSDPGRQAEAARDFPDARIVPTPDDLFNAAHALDLVVIASPNRTHVPLAEHAINAGLATVVDKPFTPLAHDAWRLVDRARSRDVLLTVFHNRRWDGDFLTVRRLIADGALGEVARFESRYERWRPVPRHTWREHGEPEAAGGLLYDLGSHLIDQALVLFGPAATVYAELDRRRPGVVVDDDDFVSVTHENGVRSHFWMSNVAGSQGPRLRVLGSRASYVKAGLDVQEAALRAGQRPGSGWGEEPPEAWGRLGTDGQGRPVPTVPGAYPAFYAGVAAALLDGAASPVAAADAATVIDVIEAARASSRQRSVVTLAPLPRPSRSAYASSGD
jgi:scyllo-inositol 2-dehydrogenase (NADP+)